MSELRAAFLEQLERCWLDDKTGVHDVGAGRFVQWAQWPDGIQVECSSDTIREDGSSYSFFQRRVLAKLGFRTPNAEIPNYWMRCVDHDALPEVAAAMERCVRDVLTDENHAAPQPVSQEHGDLGQCLLRWFGAANLAYPYVPDFAISQLRSERPRTLTTQVVDPQALYLFLPAATDLLKRPAEEVFAVSHWGHGINSYAWTVLLQRPGLRLLMQVPYGGAFRDPVEEADGVAEMFGLVGEIDRDVPYGHTPEIVVLSSNFRGIKATGVAPVDEVPLEDWLGVTASDSHPLLVIDDLVVREPAAPLPTETRQQRLNREAGIMAEWAQRYPAAADGEVDPEADLDLALAMAGWVDPKQPHRWLPITLGHFECAFCEHVEGHSLHRHTLTT